MAGPAGIVFLHAIVEFAGIELNMKDLREEARNEALGLALSSTSSDLSLASMNR